MWDLLLVHRKCFIAVQTLWGQRDPGRESRAVIEGSHQLPPFLFMVFFCSGYFRPTSSRRSLVRTYVLSDSSALQVNTSEVTKRNGRRAPVGALRYVVSGVGASTQLIAPYI